MVAVSDLDIFEKSNKSSKIEKWKRTLEEGLDCIEKSITWTRAKLPPSKEATPRKIVSERKLDGDDHVPSY